MTENPSLSESGDDAEEAGPERKCVATGERHNVGRMLRFVLSPNGEAVPDLAHVLPGRGVWVMSERAAVDKAAKGAFSKGFKAPARAPMGLAANVEGLLARRIVDLLGFARRAGEIVMGFAKVEEALRDSNFAVDCLIVASGSGPADRGKLLQMAARRVPAPMIMGLLSSDEISLAFGRENVVHAALKCGGLSARVRAEVERLSGFRPLVPKDWGP